VSQRVRGIDITATLLALLDVPAANAALEGRDLLGALRSRELTDLPALSETSGLAGHHVSLTDDSGLQFYRVRDRELLFDPAVSPIHDLAPERAAEVAELREKTDAMLQGFEWIGGEKHQSTDGLAEELKALGYVE
jgi:arylsulfatase A-like enzyme